MKIDLPSFPESVVRVIVGDAKTDVISGTQAQVEVDLPEGQCEQCVEVQAVGINNGGQPVGEPVVVKPSEPCECYPPTPVVDPPVVGTPVDPPVVDPPAISLESKLTLDPEKTIDSPFPEPEVKRGPGPKGPQKKGL